MLSTKCLSVSSPLGLRRAEASRSAVSSSENFHFGSFLSLKDSLDDDDGWVFCVIDPGLLVALLHSPLGRKISRAITIVTPIQKKWPKGLSTS